MIKVDVSADSKFPVDRESIRRVVGDVLKDRGVGGNIYVSVSVVGDRKMRQLNREYRNKDYATDVLSFPTIDPTQPMDDGGFFQAGDVRELGDIVVSYPQAVSIASKRNELVDVIVGELVAHGMLHLLGIHHD